MSDHETINEHTGVECPWCGEFNGDSWDWAHDGSQWQDEAKTEIDCDSCGRPILVITSVSITLTARRGEESDDE